ncbi:MAG: rhomboid family intramembrane serine protease [Bacteroidales bacterium]|nr:rhomboid family intramembrane serine protease [Bacteroidales bacterium]
MNRLFAGMPPVVKNLIIINVVMLILTELLKMSGINLNGILGLYFPKSEFFRSWQVVTHMFMHGGYIHLLFNMFALWMFGRVLEQVWGPKRFLLYYLATGLGAAFFFELVQYIQYNKVMGILSPEQLQLVYDSGGEAISQSRNAADAQMGKLNSILNVPVVGASGAVYGVLLAFGMLFPNTQLMFIFPPIPVKAKYVVIGYAAIELYLAITSPGSNVAHAAHLGGMIFGYILIRFWRKTTKTLY